LASAAWSAGRVTAAAAAMAVAERKVRRFMGVVEWE
jgi:hypothetical protein